MDKSEDDPNNKDYPHKYVDQILENADQLLKETEGDYPRVCFGLAYVAAMVALDPKQDRPLFAFQVLLSAYQSALDHTVRDSREYKEWLALQKQEKAGFH